MSEFPAVYARLRTILKPYSPQLVVVQDTPEAYYLDTKRMMPNKQPLFFGAAQVKKNYVSYYLMPVYVFPELLAGMSPELKKRMQGKSCFNFTKVDEPLFEELTRLTAAGMAKYESQGWMS